MSLLTPRAAESYARLATDHEWEATTAAYYEDIYNEMLSTIDGRVVEVHEGEYAEVDEHADLEAAAEVVSRHRSVWGEDGPQSR